MRGGNFRAEKAKPSRTAALPDPAFAPSGCRAAPEHATRTIPRALISRVLTAGIFPKTPETPPRRGLRVPRRVPSNGSRIDAVARPEHLGLLGDLAIRARGTDVELDVEALLRVTLPREHVHVQVVRTLGVEIGAAAGVVLADEHRVTPDHAALAARRLDRERHVRVVVALV